MSYCGVGNVPKGKKRGTAKECIKANQVRYYGLEKIDIDKINKIKKKSKTGSYIDESLKLINLNTKAKVLTQKIRTAKAIISSDGTTKSQKNEAEKNLKAYFNTRPKLIKKIKNQQKIVTDLKQKEDLKQKPVKKPVKQKIDTNLKQKPVKKPVKQSGSKTNRTIKQSGSKTKRTIKQSGSKKKRTCKK